MSDLSTQYLGLTLKSPLLASASPLSESVDNIKRLEDQASRRRGACPLFLRNNSNWKA